MAWNTTPQRRILKEQDLDSISREIGSSYAIHGNRDLHNDPLHQGLVSATQLGNGLSIHTVDVIDLDDFAAEASMPASISFSFVLNGRVTMTVDGEDMVVGGENGVPEGGHFYLPEPHRFIRRAKRNQRLRAAIVTATPDWFAKRGDHLATSKAYALLETSPISYGKWKLSSRQIMLAEQLLRPPQFEPLLHEMFLESRAVEALAEGLCVVSGAQPNPAYSLRQRDRERLEAIKNFIESTEAHNISLEDMAKRFGINVKMLQRDFRVAFGTTVFNYLRECRLLSAQAALVENGVTVAEAAYIAGYISPANFSTAFRKRFGISPKQIRIK